MSSIFTSKLSLLSVVACFLVGSSAPAQTLKGGIQKGDYYSPGGTGTTLNRNDVMNGDPFKSADPGPSDQFEPPGGLNVPTMGTAPPPPPSRAFPLNAQDQGSQDFNGQQQQAMPAQQQQRPFNLNTQTGGQPQFNPNDPDSSPEMQLAWDAWHKRVAEAIYTRFATLANAAFYVSRPMAASAAYTVTRDGRILGVRMLEKNQNPIYNAIILTAINSLNGQAAVLQFPQGSRRMSVEKSGTFTQNYGPNQGFKHTTGDVERFKQR